MEPKTPVMLLVLVETARLRWFAAALGHGGPPVLLLRSDLGDLEKYCGLEFDDQLAFLRHRFCGVLQRGCDRLWARNCKAFQFVFVFDDLLPDPTGRLTQEFAEHLTLWMLNPPVVVFTSTGGSGAEAAAELRPLAGQLDPAWGELLLAQLGGLRTARADPDAWEFVPKKVG